MKSVRHTLNTFVGPNLERLAYISGCKPRLCLHDSQGRVLFDFGRWDYPHLLYAVEFVVEKRPEFEGQLEPWFAEQGRGPEQTK